MQQDAAVKRLSVAMSGSVAAHVLFGFAFLWYVSANLEPSITERLMVLTLQSSFPTDEVADDHSDVAPTDARNVNGPAQSAQSNAPTAPEAAAPDAIVETQTTPYEAAAAAETQTSDVQDSHLPVDQPSAVEPEANTTDEMAMVPNVVLTRQSDLSTRPDNPNIEPVPVQEVAVSPVQQKMLQDKFTQWAENFHKFDTQETSVSWKKKGQEYVARFRRLPAQDDMGIERVEVEISTEQQGVRLATQMTMKNLAFSNYGQFVHRWNPGVQIHDDEMDGRFHSNSKINIAYDRKIRPVFMGKVTTSSRVVNFSESRGYQSKKQIFQGGLQVGVKRILLPDRYLPFPDATPVEGAQTHYFEEATRIEFLPDGSFDWSPADTGEGRYTVQLSEQSTYLIGARGKTLHVSGVVNGKVLVYSPDRIVIEDDLVYAHKPGSAYGADDYIGLVSDKYIDIAGPDVTGSGDLTIHAAIYARRKFTVKRYRVRENSMLHIYGSLTVGSLSATEPRFNTRIKFDERLENLRPPGFPVTSRYEVEEWDGAWSEQ